jgi:hypothetical protein
MGNTKDMKLIDAAANGNIAHVETLLKPRLFGMIKAANVNAADNDGCTPLFVASRNDRNEIVELPICKEADSMFNSTICIFQKKNNLVKGVIK